MTAPIRASAWKNQEQAIRVLIVDDSVVVRAVLDQILTAAPGFRVAHKTGNAAQALAFLERERVDIILLDVEMPGESGLVALPAILRSGQGAKVVILSGNCEEDSAAAVEALALGAADVFAKPGSGSFGDAFSRGLLARLVRIIGQKPAGAVARSPVRLRSPEAEAPLACIGIGASTGGIHALGQLFAGLSAPPGVPILLTQHLPSSFIPFFATQLGRMTSLPVKVAEQGDELRPDHVYVAPGEANLQCRRLLCGKVVATLNPARAPSGSLPAVDPMFTAMAAVYGAGSCGIVLTGMGRDGMAGGQRIAEAGGRIIAQDEQSSVIWGMPGSVARAGLASALLRPEAIMGFIARHRGGAA